MSTRIHNGNFSNFKFPSSWSKRSSGIKDTLYKKFDISYSYYGLKILIKGRMVLQHVHSCVLFKTILGFCCCWELSVISCLWWVLRQTYVVYGFNLLSYHLNLSLSYLIDLAGLWRRSLMAGLLSLSVVFLTY